MVLNTFYGVSDCLKLSNTVPDLGYFCRNYKKIAGKYRKYSSGIFASFFMQKVPENQYITAER